MPVDGVQAEPVHPLLAGAWQLVRGPVALWAGGGLQSWGKPRWCLSPTVQPGQARGSEGRVEMCLWKWWCFPALLGEHKGCAGFGLSQLEAMLALMPGHRAPGC